MRRTDLLARPTHAQLLPQAQALAHKTPEHGQAVSDLIARRSTR